MSKITNTQVYGINKSIVASGYPMSDKILDKEYWTWDEEQNEKDIKRCNRLAAAPVGSGHDQFLTSIIVQFDLTFPLKAWVELQRYHFIDFCSSMSTMHRITKMNLYECCNEYVDNEIIEKVNEYINLYKENPSDENFYKLIYNIPSGFEYTARLTTNYRQLKTIYHQRKNHRLPDWHIFCNWIEGLPYSEWITGDIDNARRN